MKNIKSVFRGFQNLNVTEVRDSDFKNAFPGIFNFTVGILIILLNSKLFELGEFGTGDGKTVRILGTRDARDY